MLETLAELVERDRSADDAIYIKGTKGRLLRTLVAAKGGKPAGIGIPGFVPKWRATTDSDDHYTYAIAL